ncbi:MAG: hypothetical protein EA362_11755 [Saprospirales bacterium]|nr:MAG: hypothetical protein EA362_11755 [Saprospirales bacterium]
MKKFSLFPFFSLFLIFPFWMGCSSAGKQHADACEQHPEIHSYIDDYIVKLKKENIQGEKTVTTDEKVETVQMSGEDLADSYSILLDLNIDLPNLFGRYGCDSTSSNGQRVESFFALDHNLTVRYLQLTYVDDELIYLEGRRKVGSVLAAIDQNLEWNLQSGQLTVKVDYKNLFGREYFYEIEFFVKN